MKSVYIHIPFCSNICTYCDFCKIIYNEKMVNDYLVMLDKEIKFNYDKEKIKTLYIGGGTPSSLNILQLKKLFKIIKNFNFNNDIEFTFECNIENVTEEKLKFLKENKVNRLSIGVETFNDKYLKLLGRNHTKEDVNEKMKYINKYFDNINIDLMYAFENQTLKELDDDIKEVLSLNPKHISLYSLIIEPHTKLYLEKFKNVNEEIDSEMFYNIKKVLEKKEYKHYEISNFSKDGYESKHNLTYWNNLEYYGFGAGASGYIDSVRYDNTRSAFNYLKGITKISEEKQTEIEKLENEFILAFRKIDGINKENFKEKYKIDIKEIYTVKKLIKENKLLENQENIYINPKYLYVMNEILIEFLEMKEGIINDKDNK
jgi:putative oxygen-independent coproporphyrinogen III oxidase